MTPTPLTEPAWQLRLSRAGRWLGPLAAGTVLLTFHPVPDQPEIGAMAALAVLMAIWWLTEALPLAATALIPLVAFPLFGIADPGRTSAQYFNPIITLFLGAFLIALAMERWHLHRRIALLVISMVGSQPARLVLGFLLASAFLSMWISNTATATMMLPIALAVLGRTDEALSPAANRRLGTGLMLAVAYGSSIGGVATLVGTPTNLAFTQIFHDLYPSAPPVTFGPWLVFALPSSLLLLALAWVIIARWLFRVESTTDLGADAIARERAALGPMSREEKLVLAVFVGVALLWTFRTDLPLGPVTLPGWSGWWPPLGRLADGTVAIGLALLLFILPARGANADGRPRFLLDGSVFGRVPWEILLLFGGGFALAAGFTDTGLSPWLAQAFAGDAASPWATMGLVTLGINFLTELTSNTATAQMFLPVLAAWATAHGLHPLLVMVPATFAASMAFMLPVATPPNAIVFGSRRLALVDMARAGILLNLISVILIVLASRFWLPLVFQFDPAVFPAWAAPAP